MRNATPERAKERAKYNRRVKKWLREPGNSHCRACQKLEIYRPGRPVIRLATECHHVRGRNGDLLLDEAWWLPVCGWCHRFITEHGKLARALGLSSDVNYREDPNQRGVRFGNTGRASEPGRVRLERNKRGHHSERSQNANSTE